MQYLFLLVVTLISAFLRYFNLKERFLFSGEIGHNLLQLKSALIEKYIPLIGPPTSHPWLSFGPFFYWIYGPILYLFRFDPLSYAYFGAFISILTVVVNFFVARKVFDLKVAVFSTILMAYSPLFLWFSLGARFFAIVPLIALVFFYLTVRIVQNNFKKMFWYGFLYGTFFSFHYTPIMLAPFAVSAFMFARVKFKFIEAIKLISGFLLSMLPILVYDVTHKSGMIKNIILWIPYRVAGFFGIIPKNTVNEQVIADNASSIWSFLSESILPKQFAFLSLILILSVIIYIFYILRASIKLNKFNSPKFLLILLTFWGFLAIFIHGSPPIHYFVPILFVPILFLSLFLSSIFTTKVGKIIVIVILITIVLINTKYFFSSDWFYKTQIPQNVMYNDQLQIAKYIINDAKGEKFVLKRVGPNDQFEGDYAQNYVYFLWLYGNEPVGKSKITYTIYEDLYEFKKVKERKKIFVGGVGVVKTIKN